MKKAILIIIIVIAAFVVWKAVRQRPLSPVPTQTPAGEVSQVFPNAYRSDRGDFTLQLPDGYIADEAYQYQLAPERAISGVKFTIPTARAEGTNLSGDTYLSVETMPGVATCSADLFLDGATDTMTRTEDGVLYSVATTTGAAAGNRYEEIVYALEGSSPCRAVRYFIHSTVLENYDPGTRTEFDRSALLGEFDAIRRTLMISS